MGLNQAQKEAKLIQKEIQTQQEFLLSVEEQIIKFTAQKDKYWLESQKIICEMLQAMTDYEKKSCVVATETYDDYKVLNQIIQLENVI